jgi:hypothetical protein
LREEHLNNNMLKAALRYAENGLPVVPFWWIKSDGTCACGKQNCKRGKHPIIAGWQKNASTDAATVVNGVSDVVENFTGYNFIRDTIFGGNQKAYNWYSGITEFIAIVGTMVCSAANASRSCQCFIAGTLVLTEDGHKKIEDIKAGDKVWAYDEKTGKKELKEVTKLFRNETNF